MQERYTIKVSDREVSVKGHMTIEEAFDFLNYYDRAGYQTLCPCDMGMTLFLAYGSHPPKEEEICSLKTSLDHQKNMNELLLKQIEILQEELKETKFNLEKCKEVLLNLCPSVKRCY